MFNGDSMRHANKLALFYASIGLAMFDLHAIASRFSTVSPPKIAWFKVGGAIIVQITLITIAYAYLSKLNRYSERKHSSVWTAFDLWRIRYAPIFILGLLAAYTVSMLCNGMVCGDQIFPPNIRGIPTCR